MEFTFSHSTNSPVITITWTTQPWHAVPLCDTQIYSYEDLPFACETAPYRTEPIFARHFGMENHAVQSNHQRGPQVWANTSISSKCLQQNESWGVAVIGVEPHELGPWVARQHYGWQAVNPKATEHVQRWPPLQQCQGVFCENNKNLHTENAVSYSTGNVWE